MAAHRTPEERRSLVADWIASDLSTAEFARSRHVSESSLHRWRRATEKSQAPEPSFVELVRPEPAVPDVAPIEIQCNELTISVRAGVDSATLTSVLAAARAAV